jgi:hypothetical protein
MNRPRSWGIVWLLALGVFVGCGSTDASTPDGNAMGNPTSPTGGMVDMTQQGSTGSGGAPGGNNAPATGGAAGTPGGSAGNGGSTPRDAGNVNAGGGAGSMDSADGGAPHVVKPCPSGLGQVGVWENITPPGALKRMYGSQAVLVNPQGPAMVYLGTDNAGLFKSTDCGATWSQPATGRNGDAIAGGESWSMVMDPVDPKVIYSVSGYGRLGLWKSTDAGVDWDQLFPPESEVAQTADGNFASIVAMDPSDHKHLVVGFHNDCKGNYAPHCQAESKDSGATWRLIKVPDGGEGSGPIIINATTWIFGSYGGLWRTSDSGATWKTAFGDHAHHYLMHTDAKGNYYLGCQGGVITSSGDASQWKLIPNSGYNLQGIAGDGKSIYVSQQFSPGKYFMASESDPMTWKEIPNTGGSWGAYYMAADRDHHIIYGSEMGDGLWRMVTY